ncbi:MAG TPA: DUF4411 family protein, partial [Candidatus Hydrogenedentes bacterium]|nr:DUF4411 family protein [Candidatus Hydrogenedentota bacterium]
MIPRVPFLLDASVFIQAAQRYYAFDLAPGFWEALITHAEKQDLCSIDRVRDELLRGNDDLAEWAREKFRDYFMSTNASHSARHSAPSKQESVSCSRTSLTTEF